MLASAAGISIDRVLETLDDDIKIRERIKKYQDDLAAKGLGGAIPGSEGMETGEFAGEGGELGASVLGEVEESTLKASEAADVITLASKAIATPLNRKSLFVGEFQGSK
jgi:hypothetical protein